MFRDFDFFDFIVGFIVFVIGICFLIFVRSFCYDRDEKDCVDFYKKNNYILNSCEKYRDKLEVLE